MAGKLTFEYDRTSDILYVRTLHPYPEQDSEELGSEVVARLNPETGDVESLEILSFSTRLLRSGSLDLPLSVELHLTN